MRILDFGCGIGNNLSTLNKHNYKNIVGIITAIAGLVTGGLTLTSSALEKPNKKDRLLEYQKAQMELIKVEEEKKAKENRNKIILLGSIGVALIILTVIVVKSNKKK